MKAVILDGYTTNPGDLSWDWLYDYVDSFEVFETSTEEEVLTRADGCEIVISNKTPLTKELLKKLPAVKFIGLLSTGYNVVDIAYAKERGIPVCNIPAYSTAAVTQQVFALLLELTNQVSVHSHDVLNGDWATCKHFCFWRTPLTELYEKTMGIIGFGQIGRNVAKVAAAFGMKVMAHTPHPPKEPMDGIVFTGLDTLLANADVVSLHCPLTPATQGMVNADFLGKMKPTAFLINTSRGAAVDEQALADALNNDRLAGFGADVLSVEPPQDDNPVLSAKNCVITPHIAWAAFETRQRLMGICKDNIASYFAGKPQNVVNDR